MKQRHITTRRIRILVGLFLACGLVSQCQKALSQRNNPARTVVAAARTVTPGLQQAFAMLTPDRSLMNTQTLEDLAAQDPIGFFEQALDRYDRSVRDYTCTFTKQELVRGHMSDVQVMEAHFRERPFSVRLKWIKNRDKCSRVLYVADRWVDKGKQMAVAEPGPIARIFVPYVMRPIHGTDAQKSSRRTIDQFGMRNSLELVLKYCRLAREKKILDFTYVGNEKVDGRETLVFERHLPYTDDKGAWPDHALVVHSDKELLLPTLCVAYADDEKKQLLGRYQLSDIKLNRNLPDKVFTKDGMGL